MRELGAKHILKLLKVLEERGPMTRAQIEEALHLSRSAVWARVDCAHRNGLIHVSGYSQEQSNKKYSKQVWSIGFGVDVKSAARAYREDLAERKRFAAELERARIETRPFRDPMTTAFYGAAHAA